MRQKYENSFLSWFGEQNNEQFPSDWESRLTNETFFYFWENTRRKIFKPIKEIKSERFHEKHNEMSVKMALNPPSNFLRVWFMRIFFVFFSLKVWYASVGYIRKLVLAFGLLLCWIWIKKNQAKCTIFLLLASERERVHRVLVIYIDRSTSSIIYGMFWGKMSLHHPLHDYLELHTHRELSASLATQPVYIEIWIFNTQFAIYFS